MEKRVLSFILAVLMILSLVPMVSVTVSAATVISETQFVTKITALQKEYPHGKYWSNENGTVKSGTYQGTSLAGNSKCSNSYYWSSNCGTFALSGVEKAWQCHGFALLLAHKIFGSNANNWSKYTNKNRQIYAGDVIRIDVDNDGINDDYDHTIFVYKVTSSKIYYADCNKTKPCQINWNGEMTLTALKKVLLYVRHQDDHTLTGNGKELPILTINYNANGGTIPKCNDYKVDTDGSTLTLRSSASTSGSVLASIPDGTIITVTEPTKSAGGYTWGKTTYNGKTGWCALDYAVQQGYKADSSGKILYGSGSAIAQKVNYQEALGTNGLWNATTFNLTRSGYIFKGWCVNKDGSGTILNESTAYKAEDIWPDITNGSVAKTLYAVWESVNPNEYTFSFDANGGTGTVSPFTVKENGSFSLSGNSFSKTGYQQIGWNVYREADNKWYVQSVGWRTEAEIEANNYTKKVYPLTANYTLDGSWTKDYSGVSDYTFYAVWQDTSVRGIFLESIPNKEKYTVGDTIDASKIVVVLANADGTFEKITSGFTVSPSTLLTEGKQTVTVDYNGYNTTFEVLVTKIKSTSTLETVNVKPSGNYYAVKYLPNSSAAGFSDGPAKDDECIILCKDGSYYLGFFPYGATPATLSNGFLAYIPTSAFSSALNVPTAADYYLNIGAHATANVKMYHRPATTSIGTDGQYTSFESLTTGQSVTVLFELNDYYCVKTSKSVGFVNKNSIRLYADDKVTGISVAVDSLTVSVGSAVNKSDITVNATYLFSGVKAITDFTLTQPDTSVPGQKYAEVSYNGFTTFVPVTVGEPVITGIRIKNKPEKTVYQVGETYDANGLTVEAVYEDGRKAEIYEYDVSYDFSAPGDDIVTVSYNGFSDCYTVLVYEMPTISIEKVGGYYGETVSVPVYYSAENLDAYALDAKIYYNSDLLEYKGIEYSEAFDNTNIFVNADAEKDYIYISGAKDEKLDDDCLLFTLLLEIKKPLSEDTLEENTATLSFEQIALYGDGCEFDVMTDYGRVTNLGNVTIEYDADGGVNAPAAQSGKYGTTITVPSQNPIRDGYKFLGWFEKSWYDEEETQVDIISGGTQIELTRSRTLYALWESTRALSSIEIASMPNTTSYIIGDVLDTDGLKLKLCFADGTSEIIDNGFEISNPYFESAGTKTITVTYGEFSASFNVTVSIDENAPQIHFESDSVKAGETFKVSVIMKDSPAISSLSISEIQYDRTAFELVSGEWIIPDMAMNTFVPSDCVGAAAFSPKTIDGTIFQLSLKASDEIKNGEYPISCSITARNDRFDVELSVLPGIIKVSNDLLGDFNGDSYLSDADAIYLLMYTFFPEMYPIADIASCDFNHDGYISDADAIYLLMYTFFPEMYPIH